MIIKNIKEAVLFMATILCLTACNKDGDETIALEFGDKEKTEETDDRIDDVVPVDLQNKIDDYMPLYRGKNPPNIEGVYHFYPLSIVFCSDGYYSPGDIMDDDLIIKFSNQNNRKNTLDYDSYDQEIDQTAQSGKGAFVSGSGNNFTAYFNTSGTTYGITTKEAIIVSGTKTSQGIKDLHFCIVMVEKKNDYDNELMDVGTYRVSNDDDGLSENATWNLLYSPSHKIKNENAGIHERWLMLGKKSGREMINYTK